MMFGLFYALKKNSQHLSPVKYAYIYINPLLHMFAHIKSKKVFSRDKTNDKSVRTEVVKLVSVRTMKAQI